MYRQPPRLAMLRIGGRVTFAHGLSSSEEDAATPPALSLAFHPCEGGCGTTLACSPYAGPIVPPFICVRCTAGKPAWQKDPPYILTADDLVPVEVEAAREYLRDADGIPLPGQVVPLNLAAYLAQDRPLDKHTVMTMLVEFAVRKQAGELAWQLLHSASAEHRGDERLGPIAVGWVTERALDNRIVRTNRRRISLVHKLAGAGDVSKLDSLVAAGVPAWKMLVTQSLDFKRLLDDDDDDDDEFGLMNNDFLGRTPLYYALMKSPAEAKLKLTFNFFVRDAVADLRSQPLPVTQAVAAALHLLPCILSQALSVACRKGHGSLVSRLLKLRDVDPTYHRNKSMQIAAHNGRTSIVKKLLVDGRACPFAALREALLHQWEPMLKMLRKEPRLAHLRNVEHYNGMW